MNAIAPESIKLSELPFVTLECYKTLPKCAAIYMVLSSENEILYIGQSVNIQSRWRSHHRRKRLIKIPDYTSAKNKNLTVNQDPRHQPKNSNTRSDFYFQAPCLRIAWLQINDLSLLESIELTLIEFFQPKLNRPIPTKDRKPNTALVKLRLNNGLTQKQVASFVGVTVQSVSNWETGLTEPLLTIPQTLALCRVLQCSLEELDAAMRDDLKN